MPFMTASSAVSRPNPEPDDGQPLDIWCARTRPDHVIVGEGAVLRSIRSKDIPIRAAAAADVEAQRWLGAAKVSSAKRVQRDLARPGGGLLVPSYNDPAGSSLEFAVMMPDRRVVAGFIGLSRPSVEAEESAGDPPPKAIDWQVGVCLVPQYRGRQMGRRALRLIARFAHVHLDIPVVTAGVEPANVASCRALITAGFEPTPGPRQHTLTDGRIVPARWFRHAASAPAAQLCRFAPKSGWGLSLHQLLEH